MKVQKVYRWSEMARWENSKVAQSERREVVRVAIWEKWEGWGGGVVTWQGKKDGRVMRWQGGSFPVLFKGGEHRVESRFHFFFSDANQKIYVFRNMAGCGSV